ncbi:STAS domain-containing protein [Streptomyces sp. H62]
MSADILHLSVFDAMGQGARCVVLDLSGVSFCDSAGLNVPLRARQQAEESDAVPALATVPPTVRQFLA